MLAWVIDHLRSFYNNESIRGNLLNSLQLSYTQEVSAFAHGHLFICLYHVHLLRTYKVARM